MKTNNHSRKKAIDAIKKYFIRITASALYFNEMKELKCAQKVMQIPQLRSLHAPPNTKKMTIT
jgi:hypothetical protein